MKKLRLVCLLLLGCLFIVGNTASATGRMSMDREKALANLTTNFQYDRTELAGFLDSGISYTELRNICLHAYAAQKPLSYVADLRAKYGWTRVKYLLGLTPEKFAHREMDYKVERLERLFGLAPKETRKYMQLGYSSHQVKRAMFISMHCDKSVEEILAMKTRQQKWGDICEELGLPRDACMHK